MNPFEYNFNRDYRLKSIEDCAARARADQAASLYRRPAFRAAARESRRFLVHLAEAFGAPVSRSHRGAHQAPARGGQL